MNPDDNKILRQILRIIESHDADIKDLQKFREGFEFEPTDISKQLSKHQEDLDSQKEDLKEQKTDFIQYFGLFVAIFTAISIDIQLLKFAQNVWSIAGLMIMVNTAPLTFFWLIKSFLKQYTWIDVVKFIFIFVILLFVGGYLINRGLNESQPDTIIEKTIIQEKQTTELSTNNEINTVEHQINEKITNNNTKE